MSTRWDPMVEYARPPAKPRLRVNWLNVCVWLAFSAAAWTVIILGATLVVWWVL